ncbi:MAG: hypothetical protein NXI00_22375, partial [Cytophagales bacterium]|nr:hypothetical protein [Cytophagales bacterium]
MTKKIALISMFCILGVVLIFHFLIYTEQIPYDKVWAGKLESIEEMKTFETFSILLNIFILTVLIIKYRQLKKGVSHKVIDVLIWIFTAFFALNTLGNLFAKSTLELVLGTALTLTSAVLCFIIF